MTLKSSGFFFGISPEFTEKERDLFRFHTTQHKYGESDVNVQIPSIIICSIVHYPLCVIMSTALFNMIDRRFNVIM